MIGSYLLYFFDKFQRGCWSENIV